MATLPPQEQEINPIIARTSREADLPFPVVQMLVDRPGRGEGLHDWLYSPAARNLYAHLVPESIIGLLTLLCPEAEQHEIRDAVRNAEPTAWWPSKTKWTPVSLPWLETNAPPRHVLRGSPVTRCGVRSHLPATPKWPLPDLEEIERVALAGPSLEELRASSPSAFAEGGRFTGRILSRLFAADSLLCLAGSQRSSITAPLSEWLTHHLEVYSFIVPSPMSSETGLTLDGRESYRTLANTGARRYLVIECDFSEYAKDGKTETIYAPLIRALRAKGVSVADMCAAVLWHLAELLPLVMVVFSGGKSRHGWFYVADQTEADLLEFMRVAVALGADPATWCKCQLVRLPGGIRYDAAGLPVAGQTVEYLAGGVL